MKLWQTSDQLNQLIEKFTVGNDPDLDARLILYDCKASIAHVTMLQAVGLISGEEKNKLIHELEHIIRLKKQNNFQITRKDEDGHTAIENHLTRVLGDTGKKVHTGRSRNDQVLVAIRMFEKDQLDEIVRQLKDLITALDQFISDFGDYPLPGYTHTRKAMPYTVGEWINALKFGLTQDRQMIEETRKLIDLNPLGTGAGYGVPFQLDREITTKLLGFSETLENSLYAQNSRGKLESRILHDCLMILYDLNRWSSDLIFFTLPELGYFVLNQAHTTGSSVMPHKKNPDVLELIRASAGIVRGYEQQSFTLPLNLISGYHRDLQWTKEPVIRGTDLTILAIQAAAEVIKGLKPEPEVLKESMTDELKSVEEIKKLVEQGIPFRDAYRIISKKFHL